MTAEGSTATVSGPVRWAIRLAVTTYPVSAILLAGKPPDNESDRRRQSVGGIGTRTDYGTVLPSYSEWRLRHYN
jgi:hypothetical protein